jgi:hypothetical protein
MNIHIIHLPDELLQLMINMTFGPDAFNFTCTCTSLRNLRPKYECDYKSFNVFVLKKTHKNKILLARAGIIDAFKEFEFENSTFNREIYNEAYYDDNEQLIELFANRIPKKYRVPCFVNACKGGNIKFINKLILTKADQINIKYGFHAACGSGHLNVVKLLVTQIDSCYIFEGFGESCMYGYKNVVDYFIDNYTDILRSHKDNYINHGLRLACYGQQEHIVEYMIHLGANNFNECLIVCCEVKNIRLVKILVNVGANNIDQAFIKACNMNDIKIITMLLDYGPNYLEHFINLLNNDSDLYLLDFIVDYISNQSHSVLKNAFILAANRLIYQNDGDSD